MSHVARRVAVFIEGISPSMIGALKDQWQSHPVLPRIGGIMVAAGEQANSGIATFFEKGELETQCFAFQEFASKVVSFEMRENKDDLMVDKDSNVVMVITGPAARKSRVTALAKAAAEMPGGRSIHWLHVSDSVAPLPDLEEGDEVYNSPSNLLGWLKKAGLFDGYQTQRVYDVRNENLYESVANDGDEWAHAAMLLMESAQHPSQGMRDESLELHSIAFASVEMPVKWAFSRLERLARKTLQAKELAPTNYHAVALVCREVIEKFSSIFSRGKEQVARPDVTPFLPDEGGRLTVVGDYGPAFVACVEDIKRNPKFLGFDDHYQSRIQQFEEAMLHTLDKGEGKDELTLAQRASRLRYFMGEVDDMTDGAPLSLELSAATIGWHWRADFAKFHPQQDGATEKAVEMERQRVQELQDKCDRPFAWGRKVALDNEPIPDASVTTLLKEMNAVKRGMSTAALNDAIEVIRQEHVPQELPPEEGRPKVFTLALFRKMALTILPLAFLTWLWTFLFGWNPFQAGWTSWVWPAGLTSVSISIWVVYIAWLLTHQHDSRRPERQDKVVRSSLDEAVGKAFDLIVNWRATESFLKGLGPLLNRLTAVHNEAGKALKAMSEDQGEEVAPSRREVPNSMLSMVDADSLERYFDQTLALAIRQRQDLGPVPIEEETTDAWMKGVWQELRDFVENRSRNLQDMDVLQYLMEDEYRQDDRFSFVSDAFPGTDSVMKKMSERMGLLLFKGQDLGRRDVIMRHPASGSVGKEWDDKLKAGLEGTSMVDIVDSQHRHRLGFLRISRVKPLDS